MKKLLLTALLLLAACGTSDVLPEPDSWDLYELDAGVSADVEDAVSSTPDSPEIAAEDVSPAEPLEEDPWCTEKRRRECARLKEAAAMGAIDEGLYVYLCLGAGRDRFQC